jgi:2-oxoglutarate ferredoxin oxidoreductase subunit gamma
VLEEIIIAGFGGQGVVFAGTLLCHAGMKEGLYVSGIPSYGPEMRGGTANYQVVISNKEITCPVISNPTSCIIMNQPSLERFEEKVCKKGLIILNSSLIRKKIKREDVVVLKIPATEIADELGNTQCANMVLLGAYICKTKVVRLESVIEALPQILSKDKDKLISLNECALREGVRFGKDF